MSPWWKKTTEEGQLEGAAATPYSTGAQSSSSDAEVGHVTAASLLEMTEDAPDEEAQDPKSDSRPAPTILEEKVMADEKKKEAEASETKTRTRRRTTRRSKPASSDDDGDEAPKRAPRKRKTAAKKSTAKRTTKKAAKKTAAKSSDQDEAEGSGPTTVRRSSKPATSEGDSARPSAPPLARSVPPAQAPAPPAQRPTGSDPLRQLTDALREALAAGHDRSEPVSTERRMALFCDLENVALGVRDSDEVKKFEIELVLERLLDKGKIIVKKAYADWQRYSEFKRPLHSAGIELIDIPQRHYSGKNSADIKMVVDALDLAYSNEHLDTFILLSGDSDFTPLVSKLKENNKHVIAVGVKNSSSKLLVDNCDEFIYYEDIWRDSQAPPQLEGLADSKEVEAFALMTDAIQALIRDNKTVLWGSMIKQTMQRKRPSFNEGYYGYSSFSDLLEDAEKKKIIHLKKDSRSGSYVVTGFANG